MTLPAIHVQYIYSACVKTVTPDVSVLHDPWFTDGVYDGAWFHFPEVPDPIASIGECDLIYVSHIHPDHYDPVFLRRYFSAYGEKEILIGDHEPNHLAGKMRADGLKSTVLVEPRRIGRTTVQILPHRIGSLSDIDSAIIIKLDDGQRHHCLVNANDIVFDATFRQTLKQVAGDVDILLCGYTGAGPYPQTYFDLDDPRLPAAASKKKEDFFRRYNDLVAAIGAKVNIPFAGQYLLGGKLVPLNGQRGVADAVEVLDFDAHAVVLDHGGSIDTRSLKPEGVRTHPFSAASIAKREAELAAHPMDYERLMSAAEMHQLPLRRLLAMAVSRARGRSECDVDYHFVFTLPSGGKAIINANRTATATVSFVSEKAPLPEPRSEIDIDPRYLFGLLTHVYHWNNAEVGSQYMTRRTPDTYNASAQRFLAFLAV